MADNNDRDDDNKKEQEPQQQARFKAQSFFERRKDRVKRRFAGKRDGEPKGIRMGRENDGKGHRR